MKQTVRKISIILFMAMLLVLMTSCAKQVPSELTVGTTMTLNDGQSVSPGNNEVSPSGLDENNIDREKILQEINESLMNLDDEALLTFNSNLSNYGQHVQKAAGTSNTIENLDQGIVAETQSKNLQELANRNGVDINLDESDDIIISFVKAGKTYTTTAAAQLPEFDSMASQIYIIDTSSVLGEQIRQGIEKESTTSYAVGSGDTFVIQSTTTGQIEENPILISDFPQTGHNTEIDRILSEFTNNILAPGERSNAQSTGDPMIMGPGSVITQGHPEIVFGVGGIVIGFFTAMFIFRKKKSLPANNEDTVNDYKE